MRRKAGWPSDCNNSNIAGCGRCNRQLGRNRHRIKMDKVIVVPNFFDQQDAYDLIRYMDKLKQDEMLHNRGEGRIGLTDSEDPVLIRFVNKYQSKVIDYFKDGFETRSGYAITIYYDGVGMNMHSDGQPFPEMGALFYLNDDYEGGELVVEPDFKYKPKALDMVYMPSDPMHGVLPVKNGTRYFFTISLK